MRIGGDGIILVLGIGNLIMSDDGVGVRVVQRIQKEFSVPGNVKLLDGGTLGLDLLPEFEGVSHLIIVDAVETGSEPGTTVRLAGEEIPVVLETKLSPHQTGLKDLLAVAGLMGNCPPEMVLIGVQPGSIEMGTDLTPEVEAIQDTLLADILQELQKFGVAATRLKGSGDLQGDPGHTDFSSPKFCV